MSDTSPIIVWIRRDLRLSDHAALHEAGKSGRPVIPVFIRDHTVDQLGAAPKWRLGLGLECFGEALAEKGSRLILRAGPAREVLEELIDETGAGAVWWQRAYDPASVERDTAVKSALKDRDIDAESFAGHLLFEPWTVETKQGGFYKVYTPYWRAVCEREVPEPLPAPSKLAKPQGWPESDALEDWGLGDAMRRGASVVRPYVQLGEQAAQARMFATSLWVMDQTRALISDLLLLMGSAFYASANPVEAGLRDAHAICATLEKLRGLQEGAGRMRLGLDPDPPSPWAPTAGRN